MKKPRIYVEYTQLEDDSFVAAISVDTWELCSLGRYTSYDEARFAVFKWCYQIGQALVAHSGTMMKI